MLQLKKAERKQAKLRIGLSAPSGAGKTYSALLLARGLVEDWSKIALIDTENGSGELYSHLGEYNTMKLSAPFAPEKYIEAIKACEDAGMDVIIIDSASHEWDGKGGCLESNELLAQTKFKGNSWAAWSVTTPKHQKFLDAITSSTCHVITCARSKTDTIQTEDKKIKKVGLKDIQREGFEYELTVAFNIDREGHYSIASKDRTGMFIDREPFVITTETGAELKKWAGEGKPNEEDKVMVLKKQLAGILTKLGIDWTNKEAAKGAVLALTQLTLEDINLTEIISRLQIRLSEIPPKENSQKDEPDKIK